MNKVTEEVLVELQREFIKWNGLNIHTDLMDKSIFALAGIRDKKIVKRIIGKNNEKIEALLEDIESNEEIKEMMIKIYGENYKKEMKKRKTD